MTPEQLRRLEALYDAVIDMDVTQRMRFIDESCTGDDELRQHVLDALQDADSGLTDVVANSVASAVETTSATGRRMGPYRIVRPLGRGGMGAVYLAVRDDDQFHKEVAIKTLKFELDDGPAVARFRHERQILAHLEHPNIARLLDGGTTDRGTPYIALEFVPGVDIAEWCKQRQLSIEERLALVCQVCDAVQYAHQHLIVHRDIKPANILVTSEGIPKLVDFGIAKLLDIRGLAGFTGAGAVATSAPLMTPDYASPEQVRGEPVSTATDIYSLGAVLYELLTHERPHRLHTYDPIEIARVVCDTEIQPPSACGNRRLSGDLDNIVLKAMHKDPSRRYASMTALADDIRRYLQGLPITARPDTVSYRAAKFVRRHRIGVAATAAVVVSLGVGVALALREARIAEGRFAQVRELANTFLFQFYDQVTLLPGSTAVRASIVETARKYLDGLSKDAGNDRDLIVELAEAYLRLANVQGRGNTNLGRLDDARRSYRSALDLYDRLPASARSSSDVRRRVARVRYGLARLEFNANHESLSEAETLRMLNAIDGLSDPESRMLHAVGNRGLSEIRVRQGRTSEALTLVESARHELLDLRASGYRDRTLPDEIDITGDRVARARVFAGDLDGALSEFQDLLQRSSPCNEDDTTTSAACRVLAVRLSWTADVYGASDRPNLNEPAKAAVLYERALHIQERLVSLDRNDRQAVFDLAARYGKLGDAIWAADPKRALDLYERALATAKTLASKEQLEILRGSYLSAISRPLIAFGRTVEARRALLEALEMGKLDDHSEYADRVGDISTRLIWARLLVAETKRAEAAQSLRVVIRDAEALRKDHAGDLTLIYYLSDAYRQLAAISNSEERRDMLGRSAAAWHSWPATTFTRREEQKDLDSL